MTAQEKQVRERLGVPADAPRVLVFAESTHWDPDWLLTSAQYFRLGVRRGLDRALEALQADPRRIYSVECLFFVKMYWEARPAKRALLRDLVNAGRLRVTSSGVTTPDTLLPETEALLRDYLFGQEWLRRNGMTPEPRVAYFPDNFGHAATVPSLLVALGYDYCTITRIDGSFFPGCDYRPRSAFPRPGSSADLLTNTLRTVDFVWRAPDGAEVLTHWNAFTYGQGDDIDFIGPAKWMGIRFGLPIRTESYVAKRIGAYVDQLAPLSPTPYMFCPIGFDFSHPIPDLPALLERYNARRYPQTGVYATLAGMDDYFDLVAPHRDRLPTTELDPNPHWSGFYTSRPEMKQRCQRITQKLIAAEKLALAAAAPPPPVAAAWETIAVSNHHDFITGTSPDRVWRQEQRPWLAAAEEAADRAIAAIPPAKLTGSRGRRVAPRWEARHGRLRVESDHLLLEFDERAGGCLTRWQDRVSGREVLDGYGGDLCLFADSGGLWRMGQEFRGGKLTALGAARHKTAALKVTVANGALEIASELRLERRRWVRRLWVRGDSPILRCRTEGSTELQRLATMRFAADLAPQTIATDAPGGVAPPRPLSKGYEPTYWSAKSFAHVCGEAGGPGLAFAFTAPAALSADANGAVDVIVLRNAARERAFGFLPIVGFPARGTVEGTIGYDFAVWPTAAGDWRANGLHRLAREVLRSSWIDPAAADALDRAEAAFAVDHPDVFVAAAKAADRGDGAVVRLLSYAAGPCEARLTCAGRRVVAAARCDARERDLETLPAKAGAVRVGLAGHLTSVRVQFEPTSR